MKKEGYPKGNDQISRKMDHSSRKVISSKKMNKNLKKIKVIITKKLIITKKRRTTKKKIMKMTSTNEIPPLIPLL